MRDDDTRKKSLILLGGLVGVASYDLVRYFERQAKIELKRPPAR